MSVGACCMKRVNVFQSVVDAQHDMYTGIRRNECASCGDEMWNNAIVDAVAGSNVQVVM